MTVCGNDASKAWRLIKEKLDKQNLKILGNVGAKGASDEDFRNNILGFQGTRRSVGVLPRAKSMPLPISGQRRRPVYDTSLQAFALSNQAAQLRAGIRKLPSLRGINLDTKSNGVSMLRAVFSDNKGRRKLDTDDFSDTSSIAF